MNYYNYGWTNSITWAEEDRHRLWRAWNYYVNEDEDEKPSITIQRKTDKDIEASSTELNDFISEFAVKE